MKTIVAPSLLACNPLNLEADLQCLIRSGFDYFHFDVMDGHLVDNLALSPAISKAIKKSFPNLFLDVHLMVSNPEKFIEIFAECGADQITFHYEANPTFSYIERCSRLIRQYNITAGIAINPSTNPIVLYSLLDNHLFDYVLIMTVQPGFGGQNFQQDALKDVEKLRKAYPNIKLGVDGGVSIETSEYLKPYMFDVLISGSALMNAVDKKAAANEMIRRSTGL